MAEGPLELEDSLVVVGQQPLRDRPLVVAVDSVKVGGPLLDNAENQRFEIRMGP